MKPKAGKHPLFNCGKLDCPVCMKAYSMIRIKSKFDKENFQTHGVAPFIGRFGYPFVNMGVFAPSEAFYDSWKLDAPRKWAEEGLPLGKIVEYRSSLMNSKDYVNIKERRGFVELNQEIAMAAKPVDAEIQLKKKPIFSINTDIYMPPSGPQARLKTLDITSNPKIPVHVEKVFSDTDFKTGDALSYLYSKEYDENYLMRLLSVGTLGVKYQRKIVPTRWSITAVDDTLGKKLIEEVKEYPAVSDYLAYFEGYLGNYYLILFFPEVWSYELFEMLVSERGRYMTDFEHYEGRKDYARETAGGYYAARLGCLEKLKELKRQASVLCLRFVTGDYALPLGVWVCRESARKSLGSKPLRFASTELMTSYVVSLIKVKFGYNLSSILNKSRLLKNLSEQRKLGEYA